MGKPGFENFTKIAWPAEKNFIFIFLWKNVPMKQHIFNSWQGIEDQPVSSDCSTTWVVVIIIITC